MRFQVTFVGRKKGSLTTSRYKVEVEACTEHEARQQIHDSHDHIHGLTLVALDYTNRQ